SHSEGLEQVVIKLRNDMHKSELERDRLAMELEDKRKLRMTLEQHLTEQQKLEAISSDHFTDSIQSYTIVVDFFGECMNSPRNGRTPLANEIY
ncbi:hypothetical protein ACJX0J_042205, partial [Zea mays]